MIEDLTGINDEYQDKYINAKIRTYDDKVTLISLF